MRMTKEVCQAGLALALFTACAAGVAGAQTTPSGQVLNPATQGRKSAANPCGTPETAVTPANANDANCVEAGPGFAGPALESSATAQVRNVMAFVRVASIIPRPPVVLPEGDTFSVVGGATLVKVHRAELKDCLATGRRISARANASTSTTCLDHKGELLAYQECTAGSPDCVVMTPEEIAKQEGSIKP